MTIKFGSLNEVCVAFKGDPKWGNKADSNSAICTDGKFFYCHQEGHLIKLSYKYSSMVWMAIDSKEYDWGSDKHMFFYKGKLYCRHDGLEDKPFIVIDPESLEEDEKATEDLKLEE